VWSDLAVGLAAPNDPIWYGFVPAGVVLASTLLTFRAALSVGALGVLSTATVVTLRFDMFGRDRALLVVSFVVLFTAVVLATARFRAWVEAGRREELLDLERKLASTQRMEAVGRLAASVAHDFNNFLTVIGANAELARNEHHSERLDELLMAVERAAALTDQLLAFARQKPSAPVPVNLDQLTHKLEPILRRLLGSHVLLTLDLKTTWFTRADPVQVEQILVNLAANARDAMPRGGTLEIATHEEALTSPHSHGAAPGEYVLLTVKDNGTGMDRATLEQAFEPFFTTKQHGKGSGLGLATVRSIMLEHGGHLHVTSELGQGTTFYLWFLRLSASAVAAAAPPVMAPPPLAGA
jgi:signal transduction histidine kinase